MKKLNIKLPRFKKPNIKKILKGIGKFTLNTFTVVIISGGGILAFSSYINPVPFIASYLPDLQYANYTLETLFADVKWWQEQGYIAWSISGGMIALGLAIHIRSIGKVIRAIKSSPRAIINFPVNAYTKL